MSVSHFLVRLAVCAWLMFPLVWDIVITTLGRPDLASVPVCRQWASDNPTPIILALVCIAYFWIFWLYLAANGGPRH